MDSKEFRDLLVDMVKSAGQDMIDRAEDLVGQCDLISDFDIWVRFPINENYRIDSLPTIEVTKSLIPRSALDVLKKHLDVK